MKEFLLYLVLDVYRQHRETGSADLDTGIPTETQFMLLSRNTAKTAEQLSKGKGLTSAAFEA